jgi:hypothetical protein
VLNGVPLTDFIRVGSVAWAAARSSNQLGFSRDYFDKARALGINLPQDAEIPVLDQLTTTSEDFIAEYEKQRNPNSLFAMYNFNPLLSYPIVRPYRFEQAPPPEKDAMVAPLPNLILSRLSVGIFYQLYNHHSTKFSEYFGHLLEEYVGVILQNSTSSSSTLLSEKDIRRTYPEEKGKVPDWAIVDGSTAVLIECKATRFTRPALNTCSEDAVNYSLKQVVKGLKQ